MQPMQPYAPPGPPPKKGIGTLGIVLIVIGIVAVVGIGACVGIAFWVKGKAEGIAAEVADGGALIAVSPPDVKAALAGPKKAYVGHWKSKKGSTLAIDADGNMDFEKDEDGDGQKEKIDAPIAAFVGNDMQVKIFVTLTVKVSDPPSNSSGTWKMRADGIELVRE
jgi:hypothetical protein